MEDTDPRKFRNTGDPCLVTEFIYHYGIYDIAGFSDGICDLLCKDTAQVGSVLAGNADLQIAYQRIVYSIGAAGDRF